MLDVIFWDALLVIFLFSGMHWDANLRPKAGKGNKQLRCSNKKQGHKRAKYIINSTVLFNCANSFL